MNIDEKIKDLREEFENKIKELQEEYELEKSGKWIPDYGEKYYYLSSYFEVLEDTNFENIFSKGRIKYNKIFETRAEAQEYADYLKARKEYSYEFSKEEWENEKICKYHIFYNFGCEEIFVDCAFRYKTMSTIYFKSKEKAQEFIDKYKKQILKFEFGIEE